MREGQPWQVKAGKASGSEVLVSCKVTQDIKHLGTTYMYAGAQLTNNNWRYAENGLSLKLPGAATHYISVC